MEETLLPRHEPRLLGLTRAPAPNCDPSQAICRLSRDALAKLTTFNLA